MNISGFEDHLDRLEHDYEVDEENDAIDIHVETRWGHEYTITLVAGKAAYSLFVSPLLEIGVESESEPVWAKLLELNDRCRWVKFALDSDGDIKIVTEGFTRLDAFGQFRRNLEALMGAIDDHGQELAELTEGELL